MSNLNRYGEASRRPARALRNVDGVVDSRCEMLGCKSGRRVIISSIMKSANDNDVNDDVGAPELYDEMDIRFPNLFFSPQWTSVINTNLGSLFNMSRQVIEGMRERKFGRIINISSINGQKGPVSARPTIRPQSRRDRLRQDPGAGRRTSRRHRQRDRARLYQHRDGAGGAERCWKTSCRQSRSAGAASRRRSDAAWYFSPPMMPG